MVDPGDAVFEEEGEGAIGDIGKVGVGSGEAQEKCHPALTHSHSSVTYEAGFVDWLEVDVVLIPEHVRMRDLGETGS